MCVIFQGKRLFTKIVQIDERTLQNNFDYHQRVGRMLIKFPEGVWNNNNRLGLWPDFLGRRRNLCGLLTETSTVETTNNKSKKRKKKTILMRV